jgi:lipopolysaccharide/colanic/teichoic acid biosynthesis glycosyltransferase
MPFTHGINNQSKQNGLHVRIVPRKRRSQFGSSFKMLAWKMTIRSASFLKRSMDIAGSLAGLIALSPFMLLLCILIKLDSPGPVIYHSKRLGKFGKPFDFLKFRSMHINIRELEIPMEQKYQELKELYKKGEIKELPSRSDYFKPKEDGTDPRITRVGRFIRKTSLDELPQLVNVLLGDMSLVGPRPPIPREVAAYTLAERKRLNVIPGITGPWQASGRSNTTFGEQVRLDVDYIQSQSFWKDCMILLKTIPAVISGRGAS